MYEKLTAILADQLRIDASRIKPDSLIKEDLGADSLDILQLLMTLEEEYGVKIPDEDLSGFRKVSDITEYLERNMKI